MLETKKERKKERKRRNEKCMITYIDHTRNERTSLSSYIQKTYGYLHMSAVNLILVRYDFAYTLINIFFEPYFLFSSRFRCLFFVRQK